MLLDCFLHVFEHHELLDQLLRVSFQVTQLLPELGEECTLSRQCSLFMWCQADVQDDDSYIGL